MQSPRLFFLVFGFVRLRSRASRGGGAGLSCLAWCFALTRCCGRTFLLRGGPCLSCLARCCRRTFLRSGFLGGHRRRTRRRSVGGTLLRGRLMFLGYGAACGCRTCGCRLRVAVICRLFVSASRGGFLRGRSGGDSALPVEARVVVVDGDGPVIGVVNNRCVHARDGCVVGEVPTLPCASVVPASAVAEAVVDAAVKADLLTPISTVKTVESTFKSPIRRGPEHACGRGRDPDSRYPVVTTAAVSPICRLPEISVHGTEGLFIDSQHRGRYGDGKRYAGG